MAIKSSVAGAIRDERLDRAANAVVPLQTREQYAHKIGQLWKDAEDKFLAIGRYLVQAKETLEHGEFEAMVRDDLHIDPAVARKLRAVAEAIDGNKLPVERLPPNYTTIYLIATMPDDMRRQADEEGLIRPDVRRKDLEAFRRQRAVKHGRKEEHYDVLLAKREKLLVQLRQIDEQLSGKIIDVTPVHVDEA